MGNELAKRLANLKIEAEKREDPLLVAFVEVLQDIFNGQGEEMAAELGRPQVEILSDTIEKEAPEKQGAPQHLPPIPEEQTELHMGLDLTPRDPESEED
ncbi:hypothetical protein LCGC14_0859610 [marine sediment metagenome]|uniref:Uncharacterized protein n=1 Tax=marine sediment metagenome TaxID=412755 RepID=A0A0F9RSF4_9ZZZZ